MTITKFKFGKKNKISELENEYVLDKDFTNAVSYRRRPSFLSQPPVQTPPDSLGEDDYIQAAGNGSQAGKQEFPVASKPWKKHKLFSSPFPRYRHSASSVSSDKDEVFIMGGLKDGSVFGDVWKIVPQVSPSGIAIDGFVAQQVEVTNNNNPPARVGHASVLCGNAYIIYGGDTVDTDYHGCPDDNFYMFNINNCKYTVPLHILNKPKGRYGHLIGVVSTSSTSSRLYLFGGQLENDVYNDMYTFELNSFKLPKARWELVEPLNASKPPPLTNHSMTVHKHKIYVFGGIYNNEKVSNDLWCFDTVVNKWLQLQTFGDLPKPVNEHSACIVSGILYVYGGNDFSGTIYDTLYALDLRTLLWSKLSDDLNKDGPGARCGHTMSFIPRFNKLIIMGGDKNDYVRAGKNDYDTYEESTGNNAGTMIFELDLATANHFMNTARPTKKAASAGGAAGLISRRTASPLPSEDAFTRHRRSLSGFEEYKTPNGSSDRLARSLDPKQDSALAQFNNNYARDKFVDVPSSNVSAKFDTTEYPEEADNTLPNNDFENAQDLQEDAAETLENERSSNNTTPILTRDFAHLSGGFIAENDTNEHLHESSNRVSTSSKVQRSSLIMRQGPVGGQLISDKNASEMQALVDSLKKQVSQLESDKAAAEAKASDEIFALKSELADIKISTAELTSTYESNLETKQKQMMEQDSIILELKNAMDPEALEVGSESETPVTKGVTELTRYKILLLELQNKLTHTEQENSTLQEKQARFEPFMNNQIQELSSLQKIIKAQESRIDFLTSQVKLELVLLEEIAQLKHANEDLEMKFTNYKVLNAPLDVSDDEEEQEEQEAFDGVERTGTDGVQVAKKNFSGHLSAKLDDLVTLWQVSSQIETAEPQTKQNDMISQLQQQVEELTQLVKSQQELSAAEVLQLQSELETTAASLKVFEVKYKDAMQAAERTSNALDLTKDELNNKKNALEKLVKENDELKLFEKASSSRNSGSLGPDDDNVTERGNDSGVAAHYNMKIKEMQAELFVIKQDNETLSSMVSSLKKELYLAKDQS